MKYLFKQANDEPRLLEVDPNVTGDDLKILLMSKLNFPVGTYHFCYQGRVLTGKNPLLNVKEGATIVCAIKQVKNLTIKHPKRALAFFSDFVDIAPNPKETIELASSLQKPSEKKPTFEFKQKNFRDLTLEEDRAIKSVVDLLNVDKAYNTSFWDYPEKAAEFSKLMSDNQGLLRIADFYMTEHFSTSINHAEKMPGYAPLLLTGTKLPKRIDVSDDFSAAHLSLSNRQREGFDFVMREGFDKDKSMMTYLKNNCDVEATIRELHSQ